MRRRRRPMAGSRVCAEPGVRRPPLLAESVALVFAVREPGDAAGARRASRADDPGLRDADARALLDSAIPGPAGRARARPDRGRDARQPARAAGAAAGADGGRAGRRVRVARPRPLGTPHRAELPPAARSRSRRRRSGCCSWRRPSRSGDVDAALARGASSSGIGARRRGAGAGGRVDRDRRPRALPPSAGALGGLSGGHGARAAGGPPRAGRGDRSATRIPIAAPGIGHTRRPDPTRSSPPSWSAPPSGPGPRRRGRRGRVPGAGDRADPRPGPPRAAARWPPRRPSSTRRARGGARAAGGRRAGAARRAAARAARAAARADRLRPHARRATPPPLLLEAAERLDPLDPALAREAYLEALRAAIFAGRLGERAQRAERGRRRPLRAARRDGRPARSTCCWTVWQPGSRRATPPPRRRCGGRSTRSGRRRTHRGRHRGGSGWRAPSRRSRSPPTCGTTRRGTGSPAGRSTLAREAGALTVLPIALTARASVHVHAGEFAAADGAGRGGGRDQRGHRQRAAQVHVARCWRPGAATGSRRRS